MRVAVPRIAAHGAGKVLRLGVELAQGRLEHKGQTYLLHASGGHGGIDAARAGQTGKNNAFGIHGNPVGRLICLG